MKAQQTTVMPSEVPTGTSAELDLPMIGVDGPLPSLKGNGYEGRHDVGNGTAMGGEDMVYMNIFSRERGFRMTSHALERSQQRCIPPLIIHWLCQYGSRKRSINGTIVCYFDKKSVRLLTSDVGKVVIRRLSSLMNAYLVTAGNRIVTVGHRYKRIKNF
ncbi:MAG: hypothetical protein IMF14_07060 [Proteobacteria bacterium]|nr:hypothetical protein [Pseudomonadota bacterium]